MKIFKQVLEDDMKTRCMFHVYSRCGMLENSNCSVTMNTKDGSKHKIADIKQMVEN